MSLGCWADGDTLLYAYWIWHKKSCADPEHSVRRGPENVSFNPPAYFTEGFTDLPREAFGPKSVNYFSSGTRTRFSKDVIFHSSGAHVSAGSVNAQCYC